MADSGLIFISAIVTALSYTYFVSSRIPKGIYRFISLLPIFYLFTILPLLLLSSAMATIVATFFITWLANFKLLLFAFNRGPLFPPKSLIHFITIASFPVPIEKPQFRRPKNRSRLNIWIESLVFPFVINFTYDHKHELNSYVLVIVYSIITLILIDLLVSASNAVVGLVVGSGLELQPPSDEPYLSTSMQDFWGRRWNLMVTNSLRHAVYVPVRSVFPPAAAAAEGWARAPAVVATFVVSGLMHELLLYYLARVGPTWEMTWFFVFHGVCLAAETRARRAVAGKFEVPAVVAWALTMGFMLLTSSWWLFPPMIKGGVDVKVLENLKLFVDYGKSLFNPLWM